MSIIVTILLVLTSCSKKPSLDGKINEENPGQYLNVASANPQYVICVIGDTGTSASIITSSAQKLQNANCDEIRHVGDIIYPKGIDGTTDPQLNAHFLTPFNPFLSANIPIYLTLGNHDYYGDPSAWLKIAAGNSNVILPSSYFATIYDFGLCAITLDSNAQFNDQIIWLSEFFEEHYSSSKCKKLIYFLHHPLYSSGSHTNAKGPLEKIYKGFILGRAAGSFSGHDHLISYELEAAGTKLFISGGFSQLRPSDPTGQSIYTNNTDLSFIKITVDTSNLSTIRVDLMKLSGSSVVLHRENI